MITKNECIILEEPVFLLLYIKNVLFGSLAITYYENCMHNVSVLVVQN